jgi:hypothetical protein
MLIHQAQLHLRIAYAGPPLSGKTETLRALLPCLYGQSDAELVFSPLAARGRTLYFDWAQYQGGIFRGGPLHCQITAVPGQASLHRRRLLLIEEADVVVFVVDSQHDQLEANRRSLAELKPWLERGDLPPIDIVYQANKRDLGGALGLQEIRTGLALGSEVDLHESNAVLGDGVRVCFAAAVRACVRRAEALSARHQLLEKAPEITTGEQLLRRLRMAESAEGEAAGMPRPPQALQVPRLLQALEVLQSPAPAELVATPPTPPAPWLPGCESTLIDAWPSAAWREVLHAVKHKTEAEPELPAVIAGTLQGRIGARWLASSWGVLAGLEAGRAEFKRLVAWLMRLGDAVSSQRCVVLGGSAGQGWCVWQVVRQELTFDLMIEQSLNQDLPSDEAVQLLAGVVTSCAMAAEEFALRAVDLPIHLDTLAHEEGATVYSTFLPRSPVPELGRDALAGLASELRSSIPPDRLGSFDVTAALRALDEIDGDGDCEALPRSTPACGQAAAGKEPFCGQHQGEFAATVGD